MPFLPFPEYRPDVDDFNGQHTQVLSGVLPRGDGYGPFAGLQGYTAALAAGNDSFTKILLHMDGANTSTTFTDSNSGGSAHTWTAAGNAQISTATYKFGGASGLFDGTGDFHHHARLGRLHARHGDFTARLLVQLHCAAARKPFLCGQNDGILNGHDNLGSGSAHDREQDSSAGECRRGWHCNYGHDELHQRHQYRAGIIRLRPHRQHAQAVP
jgi:hypothetical protein